MTRAMLLVNTLRARAERGTASRTLGCGQALLAGRPGGNLRCSDVASQRVAGGRRPSSWRGQASPATAPPLPARPLPASPSAGGGGAGPCRYAAARMDLRRLRAGEWWRRRRAWRCSCRCPALVRRQPTAHRRWESLAVIDVLLALVAASGVLLADRDGLAARARRADRARRRWSARRASSALVLVLLRVLDLPDGARDASGASGSALAGAARLVVGGAAGDARRAPVAAGPRRPTRPGARCRSRRDRDAPAPPPGTVSARARRRAHRRVRGRGRGCSPTWAARSAGARCSRPPG